VELGCDSLHPAQRLHPFYDENTSALYKQIMTGAYDFPAQYWADVSDSAKNLIRGMLMV
jgi:hypothetical protein